MGDVDRAQALINTVWSEVSEARQREALLPFHAGVLVPQPPYHSKMQVLQQRLQYHFQLAEFAEGPDLQFVYPTALTAQEHALVHEMVPSFQLHDITVTLRNGLLHVTVIKANITTHPVMVLDRLLTLLAEFLFNDTQVSFEFRPGLAPHHHASVEKLCLALRVFVVFGDDRCTVSRTPPASRKKAKEAAPPSLPLYLSPEDQQQMEDLLAKYASEVEEGEPGLEGMRYTGNLARSRTAFPGGQRQRYFVDQRLKTEMLEFRKQLPAYKKWEEIMSAIRNNRVTVVMGETGSGKTTQIPQFLLDELVGDKNGQVVVTQPRRISAITVAERVARERGQQLGAEVGYQVRFESSVCAGTRLLFCTSGILLRRLHSDPTLEGVAVVVVDEIHERDCNSDFILIILKQLLAYTRPDLRLVLMSATVEAGQFQNYFREVNPGQLPPLVTIEGTTHPVDEYFLEDAVEWTHYHYDQRDGTKPSKRKWEEMMDPDRIIPPKNSVDRLREIAKTYKEWSATTGVRYSDRTLGVVAQVDCDDVTCIQYELIVELCAYWTNAQTQGAILVFVPGWAEIKAVMGRLQQHHLSGYWTLYALHSQVASHDQQRVFLPAPNGTRKIVISTNIAESSVTINDVVFVIDSGVKKEKTYDPATNMPCLDAALVAKANALQRKGRAGRCQHGVCVHLFSRVRWAELDDYQQPEILRTPLEELCLQIKMLNLGGIAEFLKHAMHPPPKVSVEYAINLLQDIQALDNEQYLTHLGKLLATLPVHPLVGKMLVFAALFKVVEPVAVIAASLTTKSAFIIPTERRTDADLDRRFLGQERQSDHYASWQAYKGWEAASRQGYERHYCDQHHLSMSTLQMLRRTKGQFIQTLLDAGFVKPAEGDGTAIHPSYNARAEEFALVTAALQCGLYPNMGWIKGGRKAGPLIKQKVFAVDGQLVRPHPASCNCEQLHGDFLVYFERLRSSNGPVYLLDSSVVHPLPTILFADDLALVDGSKKDSQIVVNQWMSFHTKGKAARLLLNLRVLNLRMLHDVLVSNDSSKFPDDVSECFAKLIRSQEEQEADNGEEDGEGGASSSSMMPGKGLGKGKGKGRFGKGHYPFGINPEDPFALAQLTRITAQTGGWSPFGAMYGGAHPGMAHPYPYPPAPHAVPHAPAFHPSQPHGGFGPQRVPR
jgi:ATP-dependent RNA helicase DHX36